MSFRRLATIFLLVISFGFAQADVALQSLSARLSSAQSKLANSSTMEIDALSQTALELQNILNEMREVEREYGQKRIEVEAQFKEQSQGLSQILGYMATLRSAPAPDFLLHPEGAEGSIEANILVEMILPQFEEKIKFITADLIFWRDINQKQAALKASASLAIDGINQTRLALLQKSENESPQNLSYDQNLLDKIAAASQDLSAFTKGLEGMPHTTKLPKPKAVLDKNNPLPWPAIGEVHNYLDGVKITTNQSVISSPVAGTVRFSKPFLDYGHMVIVEPQKDVLLILSGFDQAIAKEGDIVKQGDILGFFVTKFTQSQESSEMILANGEHDLYVELRADGKAVIPSKYFTFEKILEE